MKRNTQSIKKSPTIIILIICFLIVVGGIWRQNNLPSSQLPTQPQKNTGSSIYTDEYVSNSLGFSVKYNPEFNPEILVDNQGNITGKGQQIALINFGFLKNNGFEIEITSSDDSGYYRRQIRDHIGKIINEVNISAGGLPGIKITYRQFMAADYINVSKVIIKNNNRDYIITSTADDIDNILSTLKFL